jgi:hypothetical protein
VQNQCRHKRHSRKHGLRSPGRICHGEERYPALRDILAEGTFEEPDEGSGPDETLEFGLQRVLDGVEAFVRARSTQPESR